MKKERPHLRQLSQRPHERWRPLGPSHLRGEHPRADAGDEIGGRGGQDGLPVGLVGLRSRRSRRLGGVGGGFRISWPGSGAGNKVGGAGGEGALKHYNCGAVVQ